MTASIWKPDGFSPEIRPMLVYEYTATAGQTTFSIDPYTTIEPAQSKVYVSGEVIERSDYTVLGTNVIIAAGVALNELVRIELYQAVLGTLEVPLPNDVGHAGQFLATDGAGGYYWSVPSSGGISVFDYFTEAQSLSVTAGDLVEDVTTPLQAAIDACASSSQTGVKTLYLPPGRYKITSALILPEEFVDIRGAGMYATDIYLNGAHGAFTSVVMNYLRPYLRDFSITGGPTSGYGLDFSNVSLEVYLGKISGMKIYTGNTCVRAPGAGGSSNFFSMALEDVSAYSYTGHSFHIYSGPGNTYKKLYALKCGPGKAGYRMAGLVHLDGCNGLNEGDYWGVFGNDTADSPGFGDDFAAVDRIDLVMTSCNVEEWASLTSAGSGIVFHNGIRNFQMHGGKFDRSRAALTAAIPSCHSIIRARFGPNNPGNPIAPCPGAIYLGATTFTSAALVADTGATFADPVGAFTASGITTFKNAALTYPLPYQRTTNDRYNNFSLYTSSLDTRHITVAAEYLKEKTDATTGAALVVDVTGYARVKLTAAGATSVSRLSVLRTPGVFAEDYLRNGELVLEATTANVTLNHGTAGVGKLVLAGAASRLLTAGEIVRFMWRESDTAWVESGSSTLANSITNADLGFYVAETPLTIASVSFVLGSHYAQRVGGLVHGFGYFDFRAAGAAGSDAIWSVQVPIAAGWDAGWSDVCVGLWSAQDGSVSGHIAKQAGVANKMVFVCTTTAAVIAASKGCRFQYTYRTFA